MIKALRIAAQGMERGAQQLGRAAEATARAAEPAPDESIPSEEPGGTIDRVDLTSATLDRIEGANVYEANLAVFRALAEIDPLDTES